MTKRPLRVLITTQSVEGYQNYIRFLHLARRLAARGHNLTLCTTNSSISGRIHEHTVDGVRVLVSPGLASWRIRRGALDPLDVITRVSHAAMNRYDLIHCDGHRPATSLQAVIGSACYRIPWISEWVDLFGSGGTADVRRGAARHIARITETWWEKKVRLLAHHVIVISRDLQCRALELGIAPDGITYIPGGADVERISLMDSATAKSRLGIDPDLLVVGLVGYEESDREDVRLALEACGRLRENLSKLRVLITGKCFSDWAWVAQCGLTGAVISPGWVTPEAYPIWLGAVDVFALPLRNVGRNAAKWPMKVGDYIAAGRPVVSNPTGEMSHLFREYEIGCLVDEDASAFEAALRQLLLDPDRRDRLGRNARALAEGPLSWNTLTSDLEVAYYKVLEGRPRGTD